MEIKINLRHPSLSIDGEWLNPVSKNRYFFYTQPFNSSKIKVSIVQKGSNDPIMMDATLNNYHDGYRLRVEGEDYDIRFLETFQGNELQIRMPSGETIRLVKVNVKKKAASLSSFSIF